MLFFFFLLQVAKQWRGVVLEILSFGIRLTLTKHNCPGCLCTPLIELKQTNWTPQTAFYWVRCGGECIYHFPSWKEHCSLFLIPRNLPLRLFDTGNINGIGAIPGAVSPLIPPALTPRQAQHETALSSWLKVLSALISSMLLRRGLDCWIPLNVTVVNISFPLFSERLKSPCRKTHIFFLSVFPCHFSGKETGIGVTVFY